MAGSVTSILDLIEPSQAQKEVTANALFEAASPAMMYARRARTSAGFTWGYYGGTALINGVITTITNGTLTLTPSRGNWIEADPATGEVSLNNVGFTAGKMPLYLVLTDSTSIVGYEDLRSAYTAATAAASGSLSSHLADPDPHPQYMTQAEADARYASLAGMADAMIFKGVIDASTNPNYPAADAGHVYKVGVAGKIGGASGVNVEAGDTLFCVTDATAAGNHATVGSAWAVMQTNVDGAVTGPAAATDNALALFSGTTGKGIKDSAVLLSTDSTFAGNSDALVPTQKAIKTYVAAAVSSGSASQPFDLTAFYPGVIPASAIVTRVPFARTVTFAAALAGSVGKAKTAATAQTDFDIQKNGVSVGTMRFAAGATSATFIAASAFSLAAGDLLSIVAPAPADSTLADVGLVLVGAR